MARSKQTKPLIGRPPVAGEARTIHLKMRATDDEAASARAEADQLGLSVSDWMRLRVWGHVKPTGKKGNR